MMSDPVRHGLRLKLLAVLVAACYGSAHANPGSPQVVAGQASFLQQGNLYTITNTPNSIINWQNFSISPNEITRFIQQSGDSKVLNRIVGQDPSKILGSLQSNGKVYLINPNGVLFGKDARVDVNGLVASSLAISNSDFLAGKNNFAGDGAGKVINQGSITTPGGGQVYLIASSVENSGVITSPQGEVVLAAGKSVQLVDSANPDVHVVVSAPSDQALNLGQVLAAGGKVGIYGALVNQRGRVSADSAAVGANGKIVLKASGTTLLEAGSRTSAVNAAGKGGEIQLLGERVGLTGDAAVDASGAAGGGSVLIGGDYQGKNAAVPHAQQTYIGELATVRADATQQGDGGKIVAWSDGATRVYGSLSARGGAQGGDGGLLETSGHYLDMQGKADTRAPKGKTGSLLLDPTDIYIAYDAGMANVYGGMVITAPELAGAEGVFLPSGAVGESLLLTSTLTSALATTDVSISTASASGTGEGTIKVVSAFSWASPQSLTLTATKDIKLNAAVTATGTGSTLALSAGGAITQTAALSVNNLTANAVGAVTLSNTSNVIGGTASASGNGVTLNAASLTLGQIASTGALSATAETGDLTANGAIQAAGAVTLLAKGAGATLTTAGAATITATGGATTLQADKMTLGGTIEGGAQLVSLLTNSSGIAVALGDGATDTSNTLGLSEAELQKVHLSTNGLLLVGRGVAGSADLTVSGNLNLGSSLGSGGLVLNAAYGNLNINSGVTLTAPGIINLQTSPTSAYTVANLGTVQAGANSGINLFTGDVALEGGHLNGSWVSIDTVNSIDVGAATTGTKMAISAADLAGISTSTLSLSNNSSGSTSSLTISQPLAFTGDLSLRGQNASGTSIDIASTLDVTGNLTLYAAGTIAATAGVSTSGVFTLNTGNWSQINATLPAFSAHDFRIAGGSFLRATGGTGDSGFLLADVYGLQGVSRLESLPFVLAGNIDASATSNWNSGTGFRPIGSRTDSSSVPYSNTFDGAGYAISGLTINRSGYDDVGLFGSVSGGTIRNLTLSGGSVLGRFNVGAVVGNITEGAGNTIENVHSSAAVSGVGKVGGLVGNSAATITGSSSSGAVTGGYAALYASSVGGLAGISTGSISTSSATGTIATTGQGYAGGLVGTNGGTVTTSYATGAVGSSGEIVGGLVGDNYGNINLSYATGDVAGGRNVGGLVGRNGSNFNLSGVIANVYATGNVSGRLGDTQFSHNNAGGLLGEFFAGTVTNAFSTGTIDGSAFGTGVNGLVGYANSELVGQSYVPLQVTYGYFDATKAGRTSDAAGATPLTTAQTMQQANFVGFSFTESPVWRIYEGQTTPLLKSMLTPLAVTIVGNGITKVYDGASAAFDSAGTTYSIAGATVDGTLGWDGKKNVGSYSIGGLYSTRYDISYLGSSPVLEITKAPLTAQLSGTRVYNGSTSFSGGTVGLTGVVTGDVVTGTGVGYFASKDVGTNKTLTDISVTLAGTDVGNYQLSSSTGAATVTPALLTVTGISGVERVYNGTTAATVTGTPVFAALGEDIVTASVTGSYTFVDKNAGSGKSITAPLTLSGTDAGNYQAIATTTGTITTAPLAISGLTGVNRVYNATTGATVTGGTLSGAYNGDTVQLGTVHAYFTDGKNVGSSKPIGFTGTTLTGADAGNYSVTSYPSNVTANVTQATLTASGISAVSRVYNGSASASLSFTDGSNVSGILSNGEVLDSVSISRSGYTASFADRNVGTGKTVTVSGLALTGTDAANYTFTTPSLSADITQLGKATWTGSAGNNLWSDANNWYGGAVPVASNVLSAELGMYGGEVIYDAGSTTLNSLIGVHIQPLTVKINGGALAVGTVSTGNSSMGLTLGGGALTLGIQEGGSSYLNGGALTVNSGSLSLGSSLTAGSYVQTGGALSGAGALTTGTFDQSGGTITGLSALTINSNYTYSGGSVVMPGSVSIHKTTGNLTVGQVTALEGISLSVGEGASIGQSGALSTNHLMVSSQGGVTLNNSANHVLHFSGSNYGSGGISLYNTLSGSDELGVGPLSTSGGSIVIDNVGGIYTEGTLAASNGAVSLTAHSPITINDTVQGDSVSLSASTGISLSSSSNIQTVHDISMTAGTGIQLAGTLQSTGGGISVLAQTGSISADSSMTISGASAVTLSATLGTITAPSGIFQGNTAPVINDGAAAAAAAAAKAAADAAVAKAAADAAAKAAADAAAKAAADAAAEAAAKAAADAAAKAAAEAAAKAVADAIAKAAADAAAKAAADAAAEAAAKAAQDAAAKAAQDAAAKAAADAATQAAAQAAAKAAADAAAKAGADAAAKAAADAAAKAAAEASQTQSNQPIGQALNTTVNIINTAVTTTRDVAIAPKLDIVSTTATTTTTTTTSTSTSTATAATTTTTTDESKAKEGAKEEKKDGIASKEPEVKKLQPAKKMYCN